MPKQKFIEQCLNIPSQHRASSLSATSYYGPFHLSTRALDPSKNVTPPAVSTSVSAIPLLIAQGSSNRRTRPFWQGIRRAGFGKKISEPRPEGGWGGGWCSPKGAGGKPGRERGRSRGGYGRRVWSADVGQARVLAPFALTQTQVLRVSGFGSGYRCAELLKFDGRGWRAAWRGGARPGDYHSGAITPD